MLESNKIEGDISESEIQKHNSTSRLVDSQLGLLQEIALDILGQVELLRSNQPHETAPNFYDEVRRFEIELIRNALFRTNGHQLRAAGLLGLKVTTLNSKIKRYNLASFRLPKFASTAKT
jgi:transcriptional regulator with GAF, ATPase, and Fis domain